MLCLAGATGRIVFERSGERLEVDLDHGRIVRAGSSRGSVRLGEALVHGGAMGEADLEHALSERPARSRALLGEWIVDRHLAERSDVVNALGDVVRRVLLGLVLWRGGRFRFEPHDNPPAVSLLPELDVERTLLDALRLADELHA